MSKKQLTKQEQRSNLEGSIIVYLLMWAFLGVFMMLLFSSCSRRVVVDNSMGGCGVWYPKKFGGQRGW